MKECRLDGQLVKHNIILKLQTAAMEVMSQSLSQLRAVLEQLSLLQVEAMFLRDL